MNILIVDNNTKHIDGIKRICEGNSINVAKYYDNLDNVYQDYDLIILTGGTGLSIDKHENDFVGEINLIKNSNKPIIGICLGFEVICHAFGCRMEREEEREKGIVGIDALTNDKILLGKDKLKVSMAHKWHVKEVNSVLIPLARSAKGIDIVKHINKPIYGFQFHPETNEPANDGEMIFKECLKNIFV
jgi:GMP synthase-like glutamine amidotransferase